MANGLRSSSLRRALLGVLTCLVALTTSPVLASGAPTILFTIKGGGWGHGIGMSQWGARGYALKTNPDTGKPYSYKAILSHYYQGTKVDTWANKTAITTLRRVRVNIDKDAHSRSSWWLSSGSDSAVTIWQTSSPDVKIVLPKTKTYWIVTASGDTQVRDDYLDPSTGKHKPHPSKVLKKFDGECTVSTGGLVRIKNSSGPYGHANIVWRGSMHFVPTTSSASKAINYVKLEEYLYGVVPRESPASWPAEALKAQAVAARSYAFQDVVEGRTLYCTTRSQVYGGQSRPSAQHEYESTTAAVDATRGQLVWYGSGKEPIKTFFFSSSGGRTANVEDVWTSSEPTPYYTSVADADQASPNYRWTYGPMMTSKLSPLIRAYVGSAKSAPAPYVIRNISLVQPASGYARYANVQWSNGVTYQIKGDQLRGALGLKSTHFGISARHEDTSKALARSSSWVTHSTSKSDNGTYLISKTKGANATLTFRGSSVKWVALKKDHYGKANVYIDGTYVETVDLYSATSTYRQTVFSESGLSDGEHKLTVKVRGDKRSAAEGTWISIDAFDVVGGKAP